jgi:hypothetical protein
MAYNPTNIYTNQSNTTNYYTDIGYVFTDISYSQTINTVKTFSAPPVSTVLPTLSNQLVPKIYVDTSVAAKTNTVTTYNPSAIYNTTTYTYYGKVLVQSTVSTVGNVSVIPSVKTSVTLPAAASLALTNIAVTSNNPPNLDQLYTFGAGGNSVRQGKWVAMGNGANAMAYSYDGINWVNIPTTVFSATSGIGSGLAFNGRLWVAGGGGPINSLAYSYDGILWNGLGATIFATNSSNIAWNGILWVATGGNAVVAGGNTLAYSYDGINWTGLGTTIFSGFGAGVAWNGYLWVAGGNAVGTAGNTIAYSYNGINWTGLGKTIFTTTGFNVAWNGTIWVMGGQGGNTLAYSFTGVNWAVASVSPFTTSGFDVAWNGQLWVATGGGTNTLAYSYTGNSWLPVPNSTSIFSTQGYGVRWNGLLFVATGTATNTIAYSYNGLTWFGLGVTFPFSTFGYSVAWGGKRENTIYLPMPRTLVLGQGTAGTIAYAYAGTNNTAYDLSYNWTYGTTQFGYSTNTLFTAANAAAWNGSKWIAVGSTVSTAVPGNTLAFSSIQAGNIYYNPSLNTVVGSNTIGNAGNVWIGMGNNIFSTVGYGIGWNGNVWVAAGQGGNSLAYSPDGFSWFGLGTTIFSNFGTSVVWNGTLWLATGRGAGNTLAYSSDGVVWNGLGNFIFSAQANQAAWNGTMWVAVGQGGNTIAFSTDSMTWTGLGVGTFATTGNGIATNTQNTMWVATGSGTNFLAYSPDGISWTAVGSIFTTYGNSVVWNGKLFVAAGQGTNTLAYSFNGTNWTGEGTTVLSTMGMGVAANQGVGSTILAPNFTTNTGITTPLWLLGGSGANTLAYSFNGIVWTGLGKTVFTTQGNDIAYSSSGTWVATGSLTNTLAYSTNGLSWTGLGNTILQSGVTVTNNDVIWVAGGSIQTAIGNTVAYSYNGSTWVGAGNAVFTQLLNDTFWNGQMWVGTGSGGNTLGYSFDGINWTGLGKTPFTTIAYGVIWSGVIWVAVGGGTSAAYSYNGYNWITVASTFTTASYDVAYNGRLFVSVGEGTNSIAWSVNGTSWTGIIASSVTAGYLTIGYGVAWNGQMWVATGIGIQGNIVYSYNGKTWYPTGVGIVTTGWWVANNNVNLGIPSKFNQLQLNTKGPSQSQTVDIVPDTYYQTGYRELNVQMNFTQQTAGQIAAATGTSATTYVPGAVSINGLPTLFYPLTRNILDYSATLSGIADAAVSGACGVSAISCYNRSGVGCLYNSTGTTGQYMWVPNVTLPTTGGYTFACWFNSTAANTTGMVFTFYIGTTARIYLYMNGGNLQVSSNGSAQFTLFAPVVGTWYHIAWTCTATGLSYVHVNGGSINGGTNYLVKPFTYLSGTTIVAYLLGDFYNGSNAAGMLGYMNNFYFFPRLLSPAEITALYTQTPV